MIQHPLTKGTLDLVPHLYAVHHILCNTSPGRLHDNEDATCCKHDQESSTRKGAEPHGPLPTASTNSMPRTPNIATRPLYSSAAKPDDYVSVRNGCLMTSMPEPVSQCFCYLPALLLGKACKLCERKQESYHVSKALMRMRFPVQQYGEGVLNRYTVLLRCLLDGGCQSAGAGQAASTYAMYRS